MKKKKDMDPIVTCSLFLRVEMVWFINTIYLRDFTAMGEIPWVKDFLTILLEVMWAVYYKPQW